MKDPAIDAEIASSATMRQETLRWPWSLYLTHPRTAKASSEGPHYAVVLRATKDSVILWQFCWLEAAYSATVIARLSI